MGGIPTVVRRTRRRRTLIIATLLAGLLGPPALALAAPIPAGSNPQGRVDAATSPDPGRLRVAGWAFDPDAVTTAVAIHVYVGAPVGSGDAEGHDLGPAAIHRPDVNQILPGIGNDHGYDAEFTTARTGTQTIYVYAVNVAGTGGDSVLLAKPSVWIEDPNPQGTVDSVESAEAAQLRVRGWGFDRNAVGTPIAIRVYVGGPAGTGGAEVHDLGAADRKRADVAQAFPGVGDAHGFDGTFTTNRTGVQPVYVYGINVVGTPGANVLLATQGVTVKSPDDLFTALAPSRILDSRPNGPRVGPFATPWGEGTTRDVVVAGVNGVPADASAVVLNATVTGTSTASHLTLWPAGEAQPKASNLNWSHGWTVANAVTVKVGISGKVSVYNAQGSVDVVLDVVGYYRVGAGAGFTAMTPGACSTPVATVLKWAPSTRHGAPGAHGTCSWAASPGSPPTPPP